MKNLFNNRAHWEISRGSVEQNIEYCTKEDSRIDGPWQIGTRPKPGKRSDLLQVQMLIDQGGGLRQVAQDHFCVFVRNERGIRSYMNMFQPRRSWMTELYVYYGPTGTGKTRLVFSLERAENLWVSGNDLKWFDGYDGHEAAVFDDFRGDMCRLRWLLRLLDRYPIRVQIKGGHVQWVPKRIYITSAKSPTDAYATEEEKIDQLTRRITRVINTSEPGWDALLRDLRAG